MSSTAHINGREITQIVSRLRQRGRHIEQSAKIALRESVNEIVRQAKSLVPVDTGNLQRSIRPIEENDGASFKIVADATNEQGKQYGRIVEFDPRINKPYLYPAIDVEKDNLNRRIAAHVRRS